MQETLKRIGVSRLCKEREAKLNEVVVQFCKRGGRVETKANGSLDPETLTNGA